VLRISCNINEVLMLGKNVQGKDKVTGKGELNSEEGEQGEGVID
jgi:hypothetical protein